MGPVLWRALWRALLAASGTALGGLLLLLGPRTPPPSDRYIGLANGASAGVMMLLTVFDIVPESVAALGLGAAFACFAGGALLLVLTSTVVHAGGAAAELPGARTGGAGTRTLQQSELVLSAGAENTCLSARG